jgi:hypothetical protein
MLFRSIVPVCRRSWKCKGSDSEQSVGTPQFPGSLSHRQAITSYDRQIEYFRPLQ